MINASKVIGIALIALFGACCHEKDCSSVNFDIIQLRGLDLNPYDTVWLDKAPRNLNFAVLFSTNYYFPHNVSQGNQVICVEDFVFNADYRLRIPSTGDEFRITNLQIEMHGCNKCYPTGHYDYYFEKLKS